MPLTEGPGSVNNVLGNPSVFVYRTKAGLMAQTTGVKLQGLGYTQA